MDDLNLQKELNIPKEEWDKAWLKGEKKHSFLKTPVTYGIVLSFILTGIILRILGII